MADLTKIQFENWSDVQLEQLNDKISRRMVWGEQVMMAYIYIQKGGVVPEHRHVSEQITHVLQGALELTIDGKKIVVRSGQVLVIPSNLPHSAVALEDTVDLDVFSPVRRDWIEGTDAYLRR